MRAFKERQLNSEVKLYPNPTDGMVNIGLAIEDDIQDVTLVDLNGKVLIENDYINNTVEVSMDISNLPSGVYIIQVNGQYAQQLVKL